MKTLNNQKILFLGTGEMGQPCLAELLKRDDVNPTDVTIITGTSEGKDKTAVEACLAAAGIKPPYPQMIAHSEAAHHLSEVTDIVVFGAKPHHAETVLAQHDTAISDNTILISMAAGKPAADYTNYVTANPKVVRIMPHLPKAAYALYGTDEKAVEITQMICGGLGQGFRLENEETMHGFTGAAGSMPAFIARFIESFPDPDMQKHAMKRLAEFAENKPIQHERTQVMDGIVTDQCMHFFNNSLKVSRHYLGEERGEKVFLETLKGTLKDLSTGEVTPANYIAKVRSKKGTTNAGLLYMGSKPPQEEAWGTKEQLAAQSAIAVKYGNQLKPEDSIIYAIIAAAERSQGAAQDATNPLCGIDENAIEKLAKAIQNKEPSRHP